MEEWRVIPEFQNYAVSNQGRVMNVDTQRIMALTQNQRGYPFVGLVKGRKQYKRSVTPLVAEAFLHPHREEAFNTPINLDGDRTNNDVENLMWRPRWFAIQYQAQFNTPREGFVVPVEIVETGEQFPTSWEAAIKYGLIDREIAIATLNRTYVWPIYRTFRVL